MQEIFQKLPRNDLQASGVYPQSKALALNFMCMEQQARVHRKDRRQRCGTHCGEVASQAEIAPADLQESEQVFSSHVVEM